MGKQRKRSNRQQIHRIAQERVGYESLRSGQEAAIKALLEGHDTLAVMPTGSGKSAIYQIAGLLIPGPTVVISPLLALQRDQVDSIAQQDVGEAVEEAVRVQERYQHYLRSRLEMMRAYAEVRDCRREYLLNYFGEKLEEPCGFCDNCKAGVIVEEDYESKPFPLSSRVVHSSWGEGVVMRYEGDKMVILFDEVGYKTLGVNLVRQRGLLKQAT